MIGEPAGHGPTDSVLPRHALRSLLAMWSSILLVAVPWCLYEVCRHTDARDRKLSLAAVVAPTLCCGTAASAALGLTWLGRAPRRLGPVLGSVFARTVLPLGVCGLALWSVPEWVAYGLPMKFVTLYLVSLAAETWQAVQVLNLRPSAAS